jgi:general secretion pathway protein L
MLAELISWWTEQMRGLVAPLSRRAADEPKDALLLARGPDGAGSWRVLRRRAGACVVLDTLCADASEAAWREAFATRRRGEPVVVVLAQPLLVRRATVPIAAAAYLDRWLSYEMDRLTPFNVADVVFSHRVLSRDPAAGTLRVEIALAPKTWVQEPLEQLAALSIRAEGLEAPSGPRRSAGAPDPEGPPFGDPMRGIPLDLAARARARLGRRVAIGVCGALAAAVIAVPFIRQSLALASVEDQLATLRSRMEQVDALRRHIATNSAGVGQIAAARARGGLALRVLGVLTDLLPDDTFLTSISLRHDRLIIEGHSAAANKLIASMTAEPQLKNPSFGAPVVRRENGPDVFTIQAGFGS